MNKNGYSVLITILITATLALEISALYKLGIYKERNLKEATNFHKVTALAQSAFCLAEQYFNQLPTLNERIDKKDLYNNKAILLKLKLPIDGHVYMAKTASEIMVMATLNDPSIRCLYKAKYSISQNPFKLTLQKEEKL